MIEKAATEKAVRDIDDRLAPAVQARQKAKNLGQQFFDATRVAGRFPAALPDRLRPSPGAAVQQRLYEDFARLPRGAPPALAQPAGGPGVAGPAAPGRVTRHDGQPPVAGVTLSASTHPVWSRHKSRLSSKSSVTSSVPEPQ